MSDDTFRGIPSERQFFSVPYACRVLGCTPPELRLAMGAARVSYAECRDDQVFLNGDGLVAVAKELRAAEKAAMDGTPNE